LFLPFPSPVSLQTNSSPIVSGNLWKSLSVQDGIYAGEVAFLSSIFFSFFCAAVTGCCRALMPCRLCRVSL
jgi:hypothetical protein